MKSAFDKIATGLNDAIAYVEGDETRARLAKPVDVKAIREANNMTQAQFAETFCLQIGTLRDWEQHRREPEGAAKTYLKIIQADPKAVERLVKKSTIARDAATGRLQAKRPGARQDMVQSPRTA